MSKSECACKMIGCSFSCMKDQRDEARAKLAECERKHAECEDMVRAQKHALRLSVSAQGCTDALAAKDAQLAAERARGERLREIVQRGIDLFGTRVLKESRWWAVRHQWATDAKAALATPDAAEEKT